MDEQSVIEHGITYAGLGALVLGACGWLFWAMLKQAVKRGDSEGTLDQRAIAQLAVMEAAYEKLSKVQQDTIDALRSRLDKIQDELSSAYSRIADMQQQHQAVMTETVGKVRQENIEAAKRLHDRLDKTEAAHLACEQRLVKQETEIAVLQRMAAQSTGININSPGNVQVGPGGASVS